MLVFILAGIGDHIGYIKKRTKDWGPRYNLEPVALRFGWRGDYAKNYQTIVRAVAERAGKEKLALIGISAGASLAIRLASEHPQATCVVTICGRTSSGGFQLLKFKSHPAYWESVDRLASIRLSANVLVIKPLFDEIVSVGHMGHHKATVLNVPYILHVPSIFQTLSKQSARIAKFIEASETPSGPALSDIQQPL